MLTRVGGTRGRETQKVRGDRHCRHPRPGHLDEVRAGNAPHIAGGLGDGKPQKVCGDRHRGDRRVCHLQEIRTRSGQNGARSLTAPAPFVLFRE